LCAVARSGVLITTEPRRHLRKRRPKQPSR
jgi:hypothetical protein